MSNVWAIFLIKMNPGHCGILYRRRIDFHLPFEWSDERPRLAQGSGRVRNKCHAVCYREKREVQILRPFVSDCGVSQE